MVQAPVHETITFYPPLPPPPANLTPSAAPLPTAETAPAPHIAAAQRIAAHSSFAPSPSAPSSSGAGLPVGARNFVDRTPHKARRRRLPLAFRLLSFFGTGRTANPYIGNAIPSVDYDGDSVLLMANMDKKAGLVNNAALRVVKLRPNAVICDMDHGGGIATQHVIYRRPFKIKLPGDTPVYVVRRQIPLVQAYAMTINKSQGMTLDRVLFDARRAPFQHGHAYVLFSRVRNRHSIGAVVDDATRRGDHLVTTTVLYDELLCKAGGSEPMADAPDGADAQATIDSPFLS